MVTAAKSWSCSEKRGEARSDPKGSFSCFLRCSSRKKAQAAALARNARSRSSIKFRFFFFFFRKENFLGAWGPFRVVLQVFLFYFFLSCWWRKTVTLRVEVRRPASRAATAEKSAGCSASNMRRNTRSCSFGCSFLFFSFLFFGKRTSSAQEDVFD